MDVASYGLNVYTVTDTGKHRIGLLIDFNQDGDFADATESFGSYTAQGGSSVQHIMINIPNTAPILTGITRLRVRASANADFWTMDPCLSTNPYYQYGESE